MGSSDATRRKFQSLVIDYISDKRARQPVMSDDEDEAEPASKRQRQAGRSKQQRVHPARLHCDVLFNDYPGNECNCAGTFEAGGVLHCQFEGEERIPMCDSHSE